MLSSVVSCRVWTADVANLASVGDFENGDGLLERRTRKTMSQLKDDGLSEVLAPTSGVGSSRSGAESATSESQIPNFHTSFPITAAVNTALLEVERFFLSGSDLVSPTLVWSLDHVGLHV